jgi:hypothetical protein
MLLPAANLGANPDHEITYNVYFACELGVDIPDSPEGSWTLWCDDSFDGWGWEPGHDCSYTQEIDGPTCNPF